MGRTEEEGDEACDHGERRVGELLDVRVGVAQARVQPRLEGVRVRVRLGSGLRLGLGPEIDQLRGLLIVA